VGESDAKTYTVTSAPKPAAQHQADLEAEIQRQQQLETLTVSIDRITRSTPGQGAPAPVTRSKRGWEPTDREHAIINIPRTVSLEAYSRALDDADVPFPEKWQRQGKPPSHTEAWKMKGNPRNRMKSERANIWRRFLKKG
jgi:hypothetical protein